MNRTTALYTCLNQRNGSRRKIFQWNWNLNGHKEIGLHFQRETLRTVNACSQFVSKLVPDSRPEKVKYFRQVIIHVHLQPNQVRETTDNHNWQSSMTSPFPGKQSQRQPLTSLQHATWWRPAQYFDQIRLRNTAVRRNRGSQSGFIYASG